MSPVKSKPKPKQSADADEAFLLSLDEKPVSARNRDALADQLFDIFNKRVFDGKVSRFCRFLWSFDLETISVGQHDVIVKRSREFSNEEVLGRTTQTCC